MKKILLGTVLAISTIGTIAIAAPKVNVGHHHPKLEAAQVDLNSAYEKIKEAQNAHDWDMGGHAQKAKELIEQADKEIKMAAEDAK